jgi:hypothetical protein
LFADLARHARRSTKVASAPQLYDASPRPASDQLRWIPFERPPEQPRMGDPARTSTVLAYVFLFVAAFATVSTAMLLTSELVINQLTSDRLRQWWAADMVAFGVPQYATDLVHMRFLELRPAVGAEIDKDRANEAKPGSADNASVLVARTGPPTNSGPPPSSGSPGSPPRPVSETWATRRAPVSHWRHRIPTPKRRMHLHLPETTPLPHHYWSRSR